MIKTLGNNIVNAFTGGNPVKAIYAYGEKVWPISGPEPTEYYIKWTPSDVSGTFSIGGHKYNLKDYSGYFTDFGGIITSSAFAELTSLSTIETNAYSIGFKAFYGCFLNSISLPNCTYIGESAFGNNTISYAFMPKCDYIGSRAFLINMSREASMKTMVIGKVQLNSSVIQDYEILNLYVPAPYYYTDYCNPYSPWVDKMYYHPSGYKNFMHYFYYVDYPGYNNTFCTGDISGYFSNSTISYFKTDKIQDVTGLSNFHKLKSCSMPYCATIGSYAFTNCENLEYVYAPMIVTVENRAFDGCSLLKSFNIASLSVVISTYSSSTIMYQGIGSKAFRNCTSLSMIKLGLTKGSLIYPLQSIDAFSGCTSLKKIYVPSAQLSYYLSASNWSYYSDIIVSY